MTLDALQELARYLNVIPGRKNLIWFSGSFPLTIEPDPTLSNSFETMRVYADDVRLTDGMLSEARVAVYPVDARGLMTPSSSNASASVKASDMVGMMPGGASNGSVGSGRGRGALGGTAKNTTSGMAAINTDDTFMKQTMQDHATMQQIAQETGGEPFLDTNGIKDAIARAVANGSSYYTIGYVPSWKNYDGALHRLKVTVDGQFNTAYRQGYYADDIAKAKINPKVAQHLMNAALEQGAPPLSELLFKVRVQEAASPDVSQGVHAPTPNPGSSQGSSPQTAAAAGSPQKPVKQYAIDYGVPAHMLDFPATGDGVRHGRLEFVLVAYAPDGKRLNSVDQNANFDLKPALYDQVLQFGIPLHQEIDLPAGQVFLRIVVRDLNSERVGAIEVPISVPR